MKVIATTLVTGETSSFSAGPIGRASSTLLAPAWRQSQRKLAEVQVWWVEVDDHGRPQREVGLNASGEGIFAAPSGKERGLWTDSPVTLNPDEYEEISRGQFEAVWLAAVGKG
jgi:hypothetical protein